MLELLNSDETAIQTKVTRKSIIGFQNELHSMNGDVFGDSELCPLKHSFCDGMYVREIFIPKGTYVVGKIHKHAHPNFLLKGKVKVATEEGVQILTAPLSMISKAGTKRALHTLEDCVWVTVHQNLSNTRDVPELVDMFTAKSYEEYDDYCKQLGGNKTNELIN